MTHTVITPGCRGRTVDLGRTDAQGRRLFRKQVLPEASIDYEGRTLTFDRPYFQGVIDAFNRRAFPSVPLQLATPTNEHNNDPLLTRGLISGLDYEPGAGLFATVAMGRDGAELVREWPELDVSVRLCEDLTNDGQHFDAALQHVLATWDPKITGMSRWEPVEMSNTTHRGPVIDLSGLDYARPAGRKGAPVAPKTYSEADVRRAVDAAMASLTGGTEGDAGDAGADGAGDDGLGEFTDAQLEEMARDYFGDLTGSDGRGDAGAGDGAGAGADGDGDGSGAGEGGSDDDDSWAAEGIDARELVDASNAYVQGLEFANRRGDDLATQVHDLTADRDRTAFEAERASWAAAGIPAHAINLARPALEGRGRTVELSNGPWDAGKAFREVFQTFAKTGLVDMSRSVGTAYDGSDQHGQDAETERLTESLLSGLGRGTPKSGTAGS